MCSSDWSSDVCSSDLDDEQTDERSRPAASVGDFAKLSGALPNAIHEVGGDLVGGGGGKGSKHRIKRVFVTHPKTSCGLHVSYTRRSEEHTSELQSLMRISYAVFCLKKKKIKKTRYTYQQNIT